MEGSASRPYVQEAHYFLLPEGVPNVVPRGPVAPADTFAGTHQMLLESEQRQVGSCLKGLLVAHRLCRLEAVGPNLQHCRAAVRFQDWGTPATWCGD